ncbi:MAG: keto-hydroxyglutarate-aldolase/keto-deoxy-phosphogluconate aldolase, partial [Clostridia bacterium]|nr:keto-hydroxyglutarate-aldolase/keto-deoxy-phosphogluconate aldolase [Clostridia bacterium]
KAIKSLAGPFVGLKFIPTGGVNNDNIAEFAASPSIHAIGGSWICPKADISAHNFDKITALCKEARKALLGFEVAHVGINTDDADASMGVAEKFDEAFGFGVKPGNSSNFAGTGVEVMQSQFLGEKGHLAVRTNKMDCAIPELEKRGFHLDMDTLKYKGDRINSVYLKDEIGGFAVHLVEK